ncbi:hypothetical protein NS365_17550 [Aureimonas ureilytica]|uniref:Uncharacterized protein n=1 Tax=Aureimonas ureilytica TaxID=401562 RepID=A0A175RIT6_9HYPH|nr:hypothetical protein [Aureimonas ureilytica]KTR03680.1 hypothetical protein NS365_17550 [Aureimonas ureilytica]
MEMGHIIASRLFYAYMAASVTGFILSRPELGTPVGLRELLHDVHGFLYWSHIVAHIVASIQKRLMR